MKKFFLILIFIGLFLFSWQCSEKNPLEIEQIISALKQPTEKPDIGRSDYTSNGSFLPGYQNGNIRSDRIILSWSASVDENYLCYKIFRDNVLKATITDKSTITHIDSNLFQNYYYNYKIVTMNKSGMFKSDTIRVKTPQFLAPTNLNYQILDSSSVKIMWENRAESASDFEIYRKLFSEHDSLFQQIGTSSDTFFVDNTVTNQEQYHYQVLAYNSFESTNPSYSFYVYVNYVLDPPFLTSLQQMSAVRSVRVQWQDNSNAEDGFRIYRRMQNEIFQLVGTVATNVTEFVDNDTLSSLMVDSTYYYGITAFNQIEMTDTSNVMIITINTPSGSASLPYVEDFENALGGEWTLNSSTIYGQIQRISGDPLPHNGQYQLLLDVSTSGNYNYNYVNLNIDLSGLNSTDNCYLRFYYQTYGEEFDNDDAVFLSSDGANFTLVYNLNTSDGFWTYVEINLRDFYTSQPYSSTYTIVWQQYDNFPYPSDGIGIDDIEIDIN